MSPSPSLHPIHIMINLSEGERASERATTNVCENFTENYTAASMIMVGCCRYYQLARREILFTITIACCCHRHLMPRASLLFTTSFLPLLNFTIVHDTLHTLAHLVRMKLTITQFPMWFTWFLVLRNHTDERIWMM